MPQSYDTNYATNDVSGMLGGDSSNLPTSNSVTDWGIGANVWQIHLHRTSDELSTYRISRPRPRRRGRPGSGSRTAARDLGPRAGPDMCSPAEDPSMIRPQRSAPCPDARSTGPRTGEAQIEESQIRFDGGGEFHRELRDRIRTHLAEPGRIRRGERIILLKTATVAVWAAASWALLVFAADAWWQAVPLAVSLGLALAGIAFNVTHDANHGSFSRNRHVNGALRWSLDLMGASSYVWRTKHNVVHHTYTNVSGVDSDIDGMPFARFAPDQPRRWFHRYQHVYIWLLYGLFAVKWHTTGDFDHLHKGSIGGAPLPWPRGRERVGFWLGKALFLSWALVVPLLLHPVWQVVVVGAIVSSVLAFTLAVTFQLAHCLEEAEFTSPASLGGGTRPDWARHQVESTVDFAPRSHFLTWYLGGLNFQVEHHLFSRVCHVHYPSMAPIVQEVCARHAVTYRSHGSVFSAIGSHSRWLRRMGAAPA